MEENNKFWENELDFIKGEYLFKTAEIYHFAKNDYEAAAKYYKASCSAFMTDNLWLFMIFTYNHISPEDKKLGYDYLKLCYEKFKISLERLRVLSLANCPEAMNAYADHYERLEEGLSREEKFQLYKKAAELGNAEAWYRLADHYRDKKDLDKAVECYQKAAELGNGEAAFVLGTMYFEDVNHVLLSEYVSSYRFYRWGCLSEKPDYDVAAKWFLKAAEMGHEVGQRLLSYCYETGRGVPKNKELGDVWWKVANMTRKYEKELRHY